MIAALMLLSVGVAYATPPISGSGTFVLVSIGDQEVRLADGNTILRLTETFDVVGTLSGTLVMEESAVIHSKGHLTYQGFGVFTGTVDGRSGTLCLRVVDSPSPLGEMTITSGTGDLANLRGHATYVETAPNTGEYTIQLHSDP
jgi:hypothetical protein